MASTSNTLVYGVCHDLVASSRTVSLLAVGVSQSRCARMHAPKYYIFVAIN